METVFKLTACLVVTLAVCAHGLLAGAQTQAPAKAPEDCGELAEVKARLETEGNLASMAELARANGSRVVLSSVMPVSNYGHDREGHPIDMRIKRPPEKILELNTWIKKYAAEKGHVYLDYFSVMVDDEGLLKKEISADGPHPNAAGYAVMAPVAEKAIQAAMAERDSK